MTNKQDRLRDMIAEEAAERLLTMEELTTGEGLLSWLRNSPTHIAEYLAMAKLNADLTHIVRDIDTPLEKLIADAGQNSNIVAMPARDLRGTDIHTRQRPYLALTAFVLAAILVVGAGLLLHRPSPAPEVQYATAHGEERTVRLADGTFVHLNTDTALNVKFEHNIRLVELERGEAFFEVAKASGRPFRVRVGQNAFQDLGTAFDVSRGSERAVVTVAEGQVRVLREGAPAPSTDLADLKAGQQATVSASGAITARSRPELDRVLAWTHEQILFDREPIGEVVAEFNRYNDLPISVHDARIANIVISGNFRVRDERAFVAFLNHLPGVRTDESGGQIIVRAKSR
jgi:transmembrane sensor